jgi:hypothetical protein
MSEKSLQDILIEVPTGELSLTGYDIGPKHQRRLPDKSNFDYREISGKDWSETLGRFVSKHQIIDRKKDRYFELVVDDETGEILNSCEEHLSCHTNHGSAKKV